LQQKYMREAAVFFTLLCALMLALPALAEQDDFSRTPDEVLSQMNRILSGAHEENAPPFAGMAVLDDAGGFDFCLFDGERMLSHGELNAFIRGMTDADGRIGQLELVATPSASFGRAYCMQADRLSRACLLSLFAPLSEGEIELLMDSYLYDARPYHYREGDKAVRARERMCEIALQEEVIRIDSAAGAENTLRLCVTFLSEADEATRERAQENGWRIRRLAQTVDECDMIQTCGECLADIGLDEFSARQDEISALIDLLGQSTSAVGQMESEHMHAQGSFLHELKAMCAQLDLWQSDYNAAILAQDEPTAWLRLSDICRLCAEIGRYPETLY